MFRLRFLSLCFVAVLAATAPLSASDLEGQIRSSNRSAVLKSAIVQIREQGLIRAELLADSTGRFEFRNLSVGGYVVHVHAEGFVDRDETVVIRKDNSKEFIQVELQPDIPKPKTQDTSRGIVSIYDLKIPDSARNQYERGLKERDKGGCAKAVPYFEKAIAAFHTYSAALNEMGKCYREAGNWAKAEDSFTQAIAYGSSIFPYINLADLLVSGKRFEQSQKVLQEGIAKFPAAGDLYFALSNSYFTQGRMKDAEEAGLLAHSKSHASAEVHLLLAKIYSAGGRRAEVAAQFRIYLQENPKGAMADRVRQNLAQLEGK